MLDATSVFHCNRCDSLFEIAGEAGRTARVVCPTCGSDLGAYGDFAQRRLDRRWVLTRGRPEFFEPAAHPTEPRVPKARLIETDADAGSRTHTETRKSSR